MASVSPQIWTWPPAPAAVGDTPARAAVRLPDLSAFAAACASELSRLFGAHVQARAQAGGLSGDDRPLVLARVALACDGAGPRPLVAVLATEANAAALLDLLLGGTPGKQPAIALTSLPPGSASWMTLTQFLGRACAVALEAGGVPSRLPVDLPPRASCDSGGAAHLRLDLDLEGVAVRLAFRLPEMAVPEYASTVATRQEWQARTQARAQDVALRVSLRIAEQRMSIRDVVRLGPGDVLPLQPPESVDVLVGGRKFARLAADGLHPTRPAEEDSQ